MITYVGNPKLEELTCNIPVLGQKMFVAPSPAHKTIAVNYFGTNMTELVVPVIFGTRLVAYRPTWTQAEALATHAFLKPEDVFTEPFYDDDLFLKLYCETPIYAETRSIADEDKVSFPVFGASRQLEGLHYLAHSIITDPDDAEQKSIALCDLIVESVAAVKARFASSVEDLKAIVRPEQLKQERRLDALEKKKQILAAKT